ncbi:hypothetical protein [Bartonella gliris]|uniref:hypothetical protein n=1 Tax=Bartonella gliris TaxID=3004109 RepID=UPI00387321D0
MFWKNLCFAEEIIVSTLSFFRVESHFKEVIAMENYALFNDMQEDCIATQMLKRQCGI